MNGIAPAAAAALKKDDNVDLPDIGSIKLEDTPVALSPGGEDTKASNGMPKGNDEAVKTVKISSTVAAAVPAASTTNTVPAITAGKTVDHPNYKEKMQLQNGPAPARVKALLDRTGYTIEVTPYMRKLGGPPPDGSARPIGTELYVGKLHRQCFEDELYPLVEPLGKIWEIRIIIDPESQNGRGFAFVTFAAPESCAKAVNALNEKTVETETGRKLTLVVTHNQHRIFVGSIPKEKTRQDLLDAFKPELEGLIDVIVHSAGEEGEKGEEFRNRGFCFLEFDTFDHANYALQRIQMRKTNPFKGRIFGNWAQTQQEPDEETMKSSKVLFLDNLTNEQSEQVLTDVFKTYVGFVSIKKSYAYAFARFDARENAEKALNDIMSGKLQAGDAALHATWARPDRNSAHNSNSASAYRSSSNRYYGGGSGGRYYNNNDYYYTTPSRRGTNTRGAYAGGTSQRANNNTRGGGKTGGRGAMDDRLSRYYGDNSYNYYQYCDDYHYARPHQYYADAYSGGGRTRRGADNSAFYAAAAAASHAHHHYIPAPHAVTMGHHPGAIYAAPAAAYGYTYAAAPPAHHLHPLPPPPPHYGPPPHHFQYMTAPAAAQQACWPAYRRNYQQAGGVAPVSATANTASSSRNAARGGAGRGGGGVKRGGSTTGRGGVGNSGSASNPAAAAGSVAPASATANGGARNSPARSSAASNHTAATSAMYTNNFGGPPAPAAAAPMSSSYAADYSAYAQQQQQQHQSYGGSGVYPQHQVNNSGMKQHHAGGGGDGDAQQQQQNNNYQSVNSTTNNTKYTNQQHPDGTYTSGGGAYSNYATNDDGFQRF